MFLPLHEPSLTFPQIDILILNPMMMKARIFNTRILMVSNCLKGVYQTKVLTFFPNEKYIQGNVIKRSMRCKDSLLGYTI